MNLHTFRLKLTALTPIHIGTGEDYEPTNFVIDENTLYRFDEVLFYKSLSPMDKKVFDSKLGDWMQIIDFYKSHTAHAKTISNFSCPVSSRVSDRYRLLKNKDGSKNNNSFQIAQTFKNPNTFRTIIPGSSIKGMLDTVFKIYSPKIKENEERQKLIVSDALILDGGSEIGYSLRKHKIPSKEAKSDIPQMVEIIQPHSTFITTITTKYTFDEVKKQMKTYHADRRDSRFNETEKSFIARIGKYNGKEYMVDDGNNVLNSYQKPIATHTLYEIDNQPFGWVKFELISNDDFHQHLQEIKQQESDYHENLKQNQQEILDTIQKAKEEALKITREKEEKNLRQKQEEEEKIRQEQEALASLSPLELKLHTIIQSEPNKAQAHYITVLNAIEKGELAEDKTDALMWVKQQMIASSDWKETSNKPEKDKPHLRTLKVKKLLF